MSEPISPVGRGVPISSDPVNRLSEQMAARTLVRSSGQLVQQRGFGTLLARKPTGLQPAARRGGFFFHPFKVINASTTGPDAAKVRVRFGQVNSVTPVIGSTPLDDDPAPELTVVSGVVYLQINIVAGAVDSVEVLNAASLPAATETEAFVTLATVVVTSDQVTAINQSVTRSLQWLRCNDNDLFGGL